MSEYYLLKGPDRMRLVKKGSKVNTERGEIEIKDQKIGETVGKNNEFSLLKSFNSDFHEKLNRGPQIITKKDCGMICSQIGLGPGMRIVEAGSGSGSLTLYLAHHVRPNGKIYSYEINEKHLKIAEKNVKRFGIQEFVEFRNKDITKGIKERDVDAVILDLPEPWSVLKEAEKALITGGYLVAYIPTFNQIQKLSEEIGKYNFFNFEIYETILRKINTNSKAIRPATKGLMHTAYLCFARKE